MKVTFSSASVKLEREDGERRAKNTSQLLYWLRDWMNENGFKYGDFIKKLMYKDGHLTDDDRHYLGTLKSIGIEDEIGEVIHEFEEGV